MTQGPHFSIDIVVDITVDTTKSGAVEVPQWCKSASLYIPSIDANGIISCEGIFSENVTAALLLASNDTSWITLRDKAESSQIAASGIESTVIDITEFVTGLPVGAFFRVVCAAAQIADRTFTITFRG